MYIVPPIFHRWYGPGGEGSGPGSDPSYTRGYREFLDRFLVQHEVRSVLDIGCGDWQFSRLVDWGDRSYLGVDVVPELVARLQKTYGSPTRTFQCINPDTWEPPPADLVICKDVLQHLPSAEGVTLLHRLRCKHLLLVNDLPAGGVNVDCQRGGYRPIDVAQPPFRLRGHVAYRFPPGPWDKVVFHADGLDRSVPRAVAPIRSVTRSIPKIIHHVWPGTDPFRSKFHACRQSWMRHHPDWTFLFWRLDHPLTGKPPEDPRLARLLADPTVHYVTKSDLLRLHVLDQYGGLYVDTDFECFRSFASLLDDPMGFFAAKEPFSANPFSPALMASVPAHPFVRAYLAAAIESVQAAGAQEALRNAVHVTGPYLMTRVASGRTDITMHPVEWFYPDRTGHPQFAKHHWNASKDPVGWAVDAARVPRSAAAGGAPVHPVHPAAVPLAARFRFRTR